MRSLATQLLRRPLAQSTSSGWRSHPNQLASNHTGLAAVLLATAVVVHHHQQQHLAATEAAPMATASLYAHPPSVRHHLHTATSPTKSTTATATASEPEAYPISIRAVKGYRVTMEDEYCVADANRFAAIFDGHGGGRVSRFLQQSVWPTVQAELVLASVDDTTLRTYVTALQRAFVQLDRRIQEDVSLRYQGSTAVAVWVHDDAAAATTRTLVAANIGDSRAVLSRDGVAVELTRDHKPNDDIERERLQAMGETIEWDRFAKVHRVRNLSLSRALGDVYARPAVSGDVEIQQFPIQEDKDAFVVLASDGLWDAMSSQDAVSFVHEKLQQAEAAAASVDRANYRTVVRRHMSKYLTREALHRGSGDNICVVVIWLQD